MGRIVQLQNKKTGENEYPRTYTKAIIDDQATPLDTLMQNQNDKIAELGQEIGSEDIVYKFVSEDFSGLAYNTATKRVISSNANINGIVFKLKVGAKYQCLTHTIHTFSQYPKVGDTAIESHDATYTWICSTKEQYGFISTYTEGFESVEIKLFEYGIIADVQNLKKEENATKQRSLFALKNKVFGEFVGQISSAGQWFVGNKLFTHAIIPVSPNDKLIIERNIITPFQIAFLKTYVEPKENEAPDFSEGTERIMENKWEGEVPSDVNFLYVFVSDGNTSYIPKTIKINNYDFNKGFYKNFKSYDNELQDIINRSVFNVKNSLSDEFVGQITSNNEWFIGNENFKYAIIPIHSNDHIRLEANESQLFQIAFLKSYVEPKETGAMPDFAGDMGRIRENAWEGYAPTDAHFLYIFVSDGTSSYIPKVLKINNYDYNEGLYRNFRTYETESDEFSFAVLDNQEKVILGIREKKEEKQKAVVKNKTHNSKYMGAIVWDGWQENSLGAINEDLQNEAFRSSTLYDGSDNWREYVKKTTGKYPPQGASFASWFDDLYKVEPSRKPMNEYYSSTLGKEVELGWYNSEATESVEAQIDMAHSYGIDYFAIVFSPREGCFDENDEVIEENLMSGFNNFMYRFIEAKNRCKMKFCIISQLSDSFIKRDEEISVDRVQKRTFNFLKYVNDKFVSDPSYLYVNGCPLTLIMGNNKELETYNFAKIKGSILLNNLDRFDVRFDGNWTYGYPPTSIGMTYIEYVSKLESIWDRQYSNNERINIYPASCGRDDRSRKNYDGTSNYVTAPTKDEFYNHLKTMIDMAQSKSSGDTLVLIYAWNEFVEGGWLMPTQYDISSGAGFYKLEVVKELKKYWFNRYC